MLVSADMLPLTTIIQPQTTILDMSGGGADTTPDTTPAPVEDTTPAPAPEPAPTGLGGLLGGGNTTTLLLIGLAVVVLMMVMKK